MRLRHDAGHPPRTRVTFTCQSDRSVRYRTQLGDWLPLRFVWHIVGQYQRTSVPAHLSSRSLIAINVRNRTELPLGSAQHSDLGAQHASLIFSREPIMKQSLAITMPSRLRSSGAIGSRYTKPAAVAFTALVLGACSSVPDITQSRVANSETVIQQAQQTIGTSEGGAVELQQAKEKLALAQAALEAKRPQEAERAAVQAQLSAELAIAKAQSAQARRSAAEVLASVEALRGEAERNSPTVR